MSGVVPRSPRETAGAEISKVRCRGYWRDITKEIDDGADTGLA
jgi:hypothetical protein